MTCRALREASTHPAVLACLGASALSCSADAFSSSYHSFLKRCAAAGNAEACYTLGMLEFYCLGNRREGVRALVRAAKSGHADALYSLAVIHFNGSGSNGRANTNSNTVTATAPATATGGVAGGVPEKKLSVGVLLCASAAQQGHVQALRELGHCFQDGYGIARNSAEGRRLLLEANLREFLSQHRLSAELPPPGAPSAYMSSSNSEAGERRDAASCNPEAVAQIQRLEAILQSAKSQAPHLVAGGTPEALGQEAEREPKGSVDRPAEGDAPASARSQTQAQSQRGLQGQDSASLAFLQSMCQCLRPLISDWGSAPSCPTPTPVHAFLQRWHQLQGSANSSAGAGAGTVEGEVCGTAREGLKVCASPLCGRKETRAREFRCCALCSDPRYCSRACQASDWRAGHMEVCPGTQH